MLSLEFPLLCAAHGPGHEHPARLGGTGLVVDGRPVPGLVTAAVAHLVAANPGLAVANVINIFTAVSYDFS